MSRLRIGELLVRAKVVTEAQLDEALKVERQPGQRLGEILVELGYLTEVELVQALSQQLSVASVSLHHVEFSRQLLDLVPRDAAERFCVLPVLVRRSKKHGDTLWVAMDDPTNESALAELSAFAGLPVKPMIAPRSDIRSAIRVYYGGETPKAIPPPPTSSPQMPSKPPTMSRATVPDARHALERAMQIINEGGVPGAEARPEMTTSPRAATAPPPDLPPPSEPPPNLAEERAPDSRDSSPEIEIVREIIPKPKKGAATPMVSLTLLDGTTIQLPAKKRKKSPSQPGEVDQLTARDLISALRAVSHGADASEILGEATAWQPMFAALLSILLRKGLIADWEFIEEYRRI